MTIENANYEGSIQEQFKLSKYYEEKYKKAKTKEEKSLYFLKHIYLLVSVAGFDKGNCEKYPQKLAQNQLFGYAMSLGILENYLPEDFIKKLNQKISKIAQ